MEEPRKFIEIRGNSQGIKVVFFGRDGNELTAKELTEVDRESVRGLLKDFRSFQLFGIERSPLKIYVDIGDTVYCFEFDDATGAYLGPC